MEEAALGFLGEISQAATLRHAVQLLTPAHVLAKTNGAPRRRPVNVCIRCLESLWPDGHTAQPAMQLLAPMHAMTVSIEIQSGPAVSAGYSKNVRALRRQAAFYRLALACALYALAPSAVNVFPSITYAWLLGLNMALPSHAVHRRYQSSFAHAEQRTSQSDAPVRGGPKTW